VVTNPALLEEDAVNRSAFGSKLLDLQRGQFKHDAIAHRDIQSLLLPQRLTHFTLHFAKYQGRLPQAFSDADKLLVKRLVTDTLIIALAAANGMNVNLQERFAHGASGLRKGSRPRELREARFSLLLEFAEIVGNMAKACEVLDHLENYPSREVLERSTADIVELCFRIAELEQVDIVAAVVERWTEIAAKSVLNRPESHIAAAKTDSISALA